VIASKAFAVPCVAIALLSGCGGGGGSGSSAPTVTTYQVSATAGTGGTITPTSATVNAGGTTTLTVTANSGYAVTTVTGCAGTLSGSTYTTGAVNASCSVTASFMAQYAVTATAGAGGTITPASATVNAGGTTTLTVTPNTNYAVNSVSGCGGTLSGNTYTTGTINTPCSVMATFVVLQYTVTGIAGLGGTITPTTATVNAGSTTTLTVTPTTPFLLNAVTGCNGSLSGTTYSTGQINGSCTVTATFGLPVTWVNGPNTALAKGIYGTEGVAATTNLPGARDKPAAWTDSNGQKWMFGGEGYDSNGAFGDLNDLWSYSSSSGEWTWVGGSGTVNATGVYGTQGTAAPANVPGRRFGPATWIDTTGNLWLFGGWYNLGGNEHWNDLWKYSTSSGEWTWVGGSNTPNAIGVYGTLGAAAPANVPGGRTAAATWTDAIGNFWLFGGEGFDAAGTYGWLNDLWKYSPSSGEWTWVGGPNTTQSPGVYGTQGTAAGTNIPGARAYEAYWMDADGNLWLFGGVGYDYTTTSYFYFNDLWKYSPASGQWTWVSGSSTVNATGVYGVQDMAAAANVPGARASGGAAWTDSGGNLWLLGGYWQNADGSTFAFWNDLWEFSPSTRQWTWVGGSNTGGASGIYGTQGVPAVTNKVGARVTPATWQDGSGNVWLFGGNGIDSSGAQGDMNDLWKIPTP
jgi:hypothetical protein